MAKQGTISNISKYLEYIDGLYASYTFPDNFCIYHFIKNKNFY